MDTITLCEMRELLEENSIILKSKGNLRSPIMNYLDIGTDYHKTGKSKNSPLLLHKSGIDKLLKYYTEIRPKGKIRIVKEKLIK